MSEFIKPGPEFSAGDTHGEIPENAVPFTRSESERMPRSSETRPEAIRIELARMQEQIATLEQSSKDVLDILFTLEQEQDQLLRQLEQAKKEAADEAELSTQSVEILEQLAVQKQSYIDLNHRIMNQNSMDIVAIQKQQEKLHAILAREEGS